jgi:lipase chaperone LimK
VTASDPALIDQRTFQELLGSLPNDIRQRIIEIAARDLVMLSASIRDAATEEQAREARHQLIGAAGGVGAIAVSRLAAERGAERQLVDTARATAQQLLRQ